MTDSDALAAIHAEAFDAPWDATSLSALLASPGVFAVEEADGFILIRVVADEAEILTLAVRPAARRRGVGARLTGRGALEAARAGARRMFLEVAETNTAAMALYGQAGFVPSGRRKGYYPSTDGRRVDAVVMSLDLSSPVLP